MLLGWSNTSGGHFVISFLSSLEWLRELLNSRLKWDIYYRINEKCHPTVPKKSPYLHLLLPWWHRFASWCIFLSFLKNRILIKSRTDINLLCLYVLFVYIFFFPIVLTWTQLKLHLWREPLLHNLMFGLLWGKSLKNSFRHSRLSCWSDSET